MTNAAGSSNPTEKAGGERLRPTPTIDLTATEVGAGAAGPAKDKVKEPQAASGQPVAGGDSVARSRRAAAGAERPTGRARGVLFTLGVGVIFGASVAAILVGVWVARSVARNDTSSNLAPRLDALQTEVRGLASQPRTPAAETRGMAELTKRLGALEEKLQRVDEIAGRIGSGEKNPQVLNELSNRVAAAEKALAPIEEINARISKLETTSPTPPSPAPPPAADPALGEKVAAAEPAVASSDQRIAALSQRIDQINAKLGEIAQQASSNTERGAETEARAGMDRAARLVALALALNAKVERGAPFGTELAAIKPLVDDKTLVMPLEAMAATGIPSAKTLAHEFSAIMPTLLSDASPTATESSLVGRLQAGAERLVRMRPVNAVAGDDPRSTIARIEMKTSGDDIEGALAETQSLPQDMRAGAQDWINRAQARSRAIAASRKLLDASLVALGKAAP